jgi:hypothetical protein
VDAAAVPNATAAVDKTATTNMSADSTAAPSIPVPPSERMAMDERDEQNTDSPRKRKGNFRDDRSQLEGKSKDDRKKYKGDFRDKRQQHGSHGRNDNRRHQKADLGRKQHMYVPLSSFTRSSFTHSHRRLTDGQEQPTRQAQPQ